MTVAHSITSSARASSVGGTSRPSALAVLRLIDELEFGRLLDRQVGGLLALEDAVDVDGGAPEQVAIIRPVVKRPPSSTNPDSCTTQASAPLAACWTMAGRWAAGEWIGQHDYSIGTLLFCGVERRRLYRESGAHLDRRSVAFRAVRAASCAGGRIANEPRHWLDSTRLPRSRKWGIISLSSSRRLPVSSDATRLSPVSIPPDAPMSFFLKSAKAAFPLLSMSAAAFVTRASTWFALSDGGGPCRENTGEVVAITVVSASPTSKALAFIGDLSMIFAGVSPPSSDVTSALTQNGCGPLPQGIVAGDENGLVASTTNMTSAFRSVVPLLETSIGMPGPCPGMDCPASTWLTPCGLFWLSCPLST